MLMHIYLHLNDLFNTFRFRPIYGQSDHLENSTEYTYQSTEE